LDLAEDGRRKGGKKLEKKQRLEKQRTAEALKNAMSSAKSVVFVDFRGVTVADDTKLRRACRDANVQYKVAKNTLVSRAIDSLGWESPGPMLEGPTALAMSEVDPTVAARTVAGMMKDVPALKIKGGILDGEILNIDRVMFLASLPPKDQLLAKVAGTMQSPLTGFAVVLNGTLAAFARAVEALRVKREEEAS
jgi:large subunit ribosomal protein L10